MIDIAVTDSGPLIHLDELQSPDLLEGFRSLNIAREVKDEVTHHRPAFDWGRLSACHVSSAPLSRNVAAYARTLDLHTGEVAALNLLEHLHGQIFLCDDAAARLAAESMGFEVHGTIGLIIRAVRRGTRSAQQVKTLLEQIPTRSSLHINRALLRQIMDSIPG
jgi:predicted nucleic acid-binding protein